MIVSQLLTFSMLKALHFLGLKLMQVFKYYDMSRDDIINNCQTIFTAIPVVFSLAMYGTFYYCQFPWVEKYKCNKVDWPWVSKEPNFKQ